jgi:hypothetical protein
MPGRSPVARAVVGSTVGVVAVVVVVHLGRAVAYVTGRVIGALAGLRGDGQRKDGGGGEGEQGLGGSRVHGASGVGLPVVDTMRFGESCLQSDVCRIASETGG